MSEGETLVLSNFWGANFVSESFCNYQWINRFRAKPYQFIVPNFWQGSQSCILGVQRNNSGRKTYLKLVFEFSRSVFDQKVLWLFLKTFWQISKKVLHVSGENSLWKAVSQEKAIKPIFFLGNLFDKSGTFGGNFPAVLSKLLSTCRVTFWWKATFASELFIGYLFWTLGANSQGFGETASAQLYKLLSTCPKEKRLCCSTFEEKILFLKAFVVFNGLTDSEKNPICFFFT